ncbi:MAG: PD40 domain-containing protein [Phycisphaerales bacterium]|nr:PD40 domain-containing protein [Phycisphaerales bacterium]
MRPDPACLFHRAAASLALVTGVVAGVASGLASAQDISPNWFRTPAISPDGTTIVFSSGGDLYVVPVSGGTARALTVHAASETRPVWSHDGRSIAFASDREGNFDVYVMPSQGGEAVRLTYNSANDLPSDFTPDDSAVIFESARMDDVASTLFPSPVLAELYSVPVGGGTPRMLLTTPALRAVYSRDGGRVLYEDRKGYENEYRKHHTSAIARDVWMWDVKSGKHVMLTDYAGEDRNPQWAEDGKSMYFLSERAGDSNVFRMPLEAGAKAEQLTSFEHNPVRDLSVSPKGDMVFSWHGDLYFKANGKAPVLVPVRIGSEGRSGSEFVDTLRSGATEFAVAPSGKEVAFVVRGDVFVTSTEFGTTRRITSTPEQERSVGFSPDGKKLVYAGERDGSWNIYESSMSDEDELYFFSATAFQERPLVATDAEEFQPLYSPDGKSLAYLYNRTALNILDLESGQTRTVMPGDEYYSYEDGDQYFRWSPAGDYIATQFYARDRAFVTEVGVVPTGAGAEPGPIEFSNSGYDDLRPRWGMEGGVMLWASERYGMKSHGSWGAQLDVVGTFLNQDSYDKFHMSKEEYELKKELDEKRKKKEEEKAKEDKAEEKAAGAGDGDDADGDKAEVGDTPKPVELELDGIERRTERLTIQSSDLADFALSSDGTRLYYLSRFEKGYDLWVRDFREDENKILKKLNADAATMQLNKDGDAIFLLADGKLSKVDAKSGEATPIGFAAEERLDTGLERSYLFGHIWRQVKEKFYNPDLHGVDWAFYRDQYAPKMAGISNNRDFAEVESELLGELNASHTGAIYRPGRKPGDAATASLGVFFDNGYTGEGQRIAEVIKGGPLDRSDLDIDAGMVITQIDGHPLDATQNLFELLDGKAGERVRLTLRRDNGDTFDQVVKPVSGGEEGELLYRRWVLARRDMVDALSGGRIGYVHVRGMNDESFREVYSEVLGRDAAKEGLIVDTRFNGGGWLHDDLVTFLTGKEYVDLYPRNVEAPGKGYFGDPRQRWTKPSLVVMSESNYSDAHFFPWAYTELKIGPTVGMPVPGTATAVWWEHLHTGDLIFGIPQVGTKGMSGGFLENTQLEPTYKVRISPEQAAAGEDTQIEKSVEVMLKICDDAKAAKSAK